MRVHLTTTQAFAAETYPRLTHAGWGPLDPRTGRLTNQYVMEQPDVGTLLTLLHDPAVLDIVQAPAPPKEAEGPSLADLGTYASEGTLELRAIRAQLGLTQAEMAELLGEKLGTYAKYEQGAIKLARRTLILARIAYDDTRVQAAQLGGPARGVVYPLGTRGPDSEDKRAKQRAGWRRRQAQAQAQTGALAPQEGDDHGE